MANENDLSGKVSLDTTDYKASVIELNRQIRIVESEFRATAAAMGQWDKNANGLELRNKALNSEIDLQKQKISALTSEYKKIVDEKGADSRAAEELQIKINKQTESLGKMTVELAQTESALNDMAEKSKKAGSHVDDLGEKEEKTEKKTKSLKDNLRSLGTVAGTVTKTFAVLGAAAIAAVSGIVVGVSKTIGPASDLNETVSKIGVVFGETKDEVLNFGYDAAQSLGMSANAALSAAGTYGNLFRAMGIVESTSADMSTTLVKLAGDLASFNNADPTEVLDSLRSGLSGETEPLKRWGININQALIQQKALELGLWNGNGALDAATKAQATYALILEQTTLAQGDFARTSDGLANQQRILAATFENIKAEIGTGFLPIVNEAIGQLSGYVSRFSRILSTSQDAKNPFEYIATGFGNIFKDIVGELSKNLPTILQAGLTILEQIVSAFIENLPVMIPAVITMLESLVGFIVESLPMLVDAAVQILLMLTSSIISMLPMLLTAALEIIVQLANGLSAALPTMIPAVVAILLQLVLTLIENLPMLINAAMQLILALAQGLIGALPVLAEQLPTIMIAIVNGLIESLPELLVAAVEIILALALGIVENIPKLLAMMPKVIDALVKQFKSDEFKKKIKSIGEDLVNGIKDGFNKAWASFKEHFMSSWNELIDKVKDLLGIHSPSTVFANIGLNMALGLGEGFNNQMTNVRRQIENAIGDISSISSINTSIDLNQGKNSASQFTGADGRIYQLFFETYNEAGMNRILRQTEMLYGS